MVALFPANIYAALEGVTPGAGNRSRHCGFVVLPATLVRHVVMGSPAFRIAATRRPTQEAERMAGPPRRSYVRVKRKRLDLSGLLRVKNICGLDATLIGTGSIPHLTFLCSVHQLHGFRPSKGKQKRAGNSRFPFLVSPFCAHDTRRCMRQPEKVTKLVRDCVARRIPRFERAFTERFKTSKRRTRSRKM